jgi:hypothetical protein
MRKEEIAGEIASEKEWSPSQAARCDQIIREFSRKITALADEHPEAIASAVAIIVPMGRGQNLFVLTDPATQDIADELQRLAEQGEESPLAALVAARIKL